MAENSGIAWTHHTHNEWLGCTPVSEACRECYAEVLVTGRMKLPVWGPKAPRHLTKESNRKKPERYNRVAGQKGIRERIFCSSLSDVFEDREDLKPWRADLFRLIERTTNLDWLLLTKRADCMVRLAAEAGWKGHWPSHVWAGTTVESQKRAEERIPHLLSVPAKIHFLSMEPLLESVDISRWLVPPYPNFGGMGGGSAMELQAQLTWEAKYDGKQGLSWVIVGGESGDYDKVRPFNLDWARSLKAQCEKTRTPFFFKQTGVKCLDGVASYPVLRKGDQMEDFPPELRVREFPLLKDGPW